MRELSAKGTSTGTGNGVGAGASNSAAAGTSRGVLPGVGGTGYGPDDDGEGGEGALPEGYKGPGMDSAVHPPLDFRKLEEVCRWAQVSLKGYGGREAFT